MDLHSSVRVMDTGHFLHGYEGTVIIIDGHDKEISYTVQFGEETHYKMRAHPLSNIFIDEFGLFVAFLLEHQLEVIEAKDEAIVVKRHFSRKFSVVQLVVSLLVGIIVGGVVGICMSTALLAIFSPPQLITIVGCICITTATVYHLFHKLAVNRGMIDPRTEPSDHS